MRDDFTRLTAAQPNAASQAKTAPARPRPPVAAVPSGATSATPPNSFDIGSSAPTTAPDPPVAPAVALAGKSETELRALFGAPTSEEDRPPGKRWRYRNGQCTLDVQLYPDVRTKQFGTLAYEVKSDDNSDEGKRHCLVQLQSRVQTRN